MKRQKNDAEDADPLEDVIIRDVIGPLHHRTRNDRAAAPASLDGG